MILSDFSAFKAGETDITKIYQGYDEVFPENKQEVIYFSILGGGDEYDKYDKLYDLVDVIKAYDESGTQIYPSKINIGHEGSVYTLILEYPKPLYSYRFTGFISTNYITTLNIPNQVKLLNGSNFQEFDLSSWSDDSRFFNFSSKIGDTSEVTDMSSMFTGATLDECFTGPIDCTSCQSLYLTFSGVKWDADQIEKVLKNTSGVTNMKQTFYRNIGLTRMPDIDTTSATNYQSMFSGCYNMTGVRDYNTTNGIIFYSMFYNTSIVYAPNLDLSNATDVASMFSTCSKLKQVPVLNTSKALTFKNIFKGDTALERVLGIDFTSMDADNVAVFTTNMPNLTDFYVNGSISKSMDCFKYCYSLSKDSVVSILKAMAKCSNPTEIKSMVFGSLTVDYDEEMQTLYNDCTDNKGWTILGLKIKAKPAVTANTLSFTLVSGDTLNDCKFSAYTSNNEYIEPVTKDTTGWTYAQDISYVRGDLSGMTNLLTFDGVGTTTGAVSLSGYSVSMNDLPSATTIDFSTFKSDTKELTFDKAFENDYSLKNVNFGLLVPFYPQLSSEKKISYMFSNCRNLEVVNSPQKPWNTIGVEDMSYMFNGCSSLKTVDTTINTLSLKDMSYMFNGCSGLNELNLGTGFLEYSGLTEMTGAFQNCSSLESLDLSAKQLQNVVSTVYLFRGCSGLKSVSLPALSSLNYCSDMFSGCTSLSSLTVTKAETGLTLNTDGMFAHCSSLTSVPAFSNSATVRLADSMFYGCSSLESVEWELTLVQYASDMFRNCTSLSTLPTNQYGGTSLISGVLRVADRMFQGCSSITNSDYFKYCSSLDFLESASNMFRDCKGLTELDLACWMPSSSVTMANMFFGCSNLKSITFGTEGTNNHWTKSGTPSYGIFDYCSSLEYIYCYGCDDATIQYFKDAVESSVSCNAQVIS